MADFPFADLEIFNYPISHCLCANGRLAGRSQIRRAMAGGQNGIYSGFHGVGFLGQPQRSA
jgi:hypothetical protein